MEYEEADEIKSRKCICLSSLYMPKPNSKLNDRFLFCSKGHIWIGNDFVTGKDSDSASFDTSFDLEWGSFNKNRKRGSADKQKVSS